MSELTSLICHDAAQTALFARVLGAVLAPGDVLLLDGPVGAGKTHFARALIQSRQGPAPEDVPSPTFTLVQTYGDATGAEIWHADLYRLTDPAELAELGLDDAMAEAITLIEWPDRLGAAPAGALHVRFDVVDADERRLVLTGDPARWGRAVAAVAGAQVMADAGRCHDRVAPLAGDASARRYLRVASDPVEEAQAAAPAGLPDSAVLMLDPPPGSAARFLRMTEWLRRHGLHAPAVLAQALLHDAPEAGAILLEDLGDDLVARVLETHPAREPAIYAAITDILISLHAQRPPGWLEPLDGPELARQVALFAQFYPVAAGVPGLGDEVAGTVAALWDRLAADQAPVVGLRDFHAENIVVLPDGLGLLDYQDAVAVHPAYDLASLLQDARRDVAPQTQAACLERYLAATGLDPERFAAVYALMGAQRGLRIMGIFTRLCLIGGKARYLAFMPRVWDAIWRNLAHPELAPLAAAMAGIPAPDATIIERIRARCGTMRPRP